MSGPFSKFELEKITGNAVGLRFLWYTFLDDARDPFCSLCDLITEGKGFCTSGSVSQQRIAASSLFASFAGMTLHEEELPLNVAISFCDIGAGLQAITEKWSAYRTDQLLSVALLLDLSGEGSVSYEDFLSFIQLANDSLQQDPLHSRDCFLTFYDCLIERIRGSLQGFFSEEDRILEARLLFLGNDARKKGLHPLTEILHHMKIENEITLKEIIVLLKSLNATVNEDEKEEKEGKERKGKEDKEEKRVEKKNDVKGEDKGEKKTGKNDEIVPMSALVDRFLNYESRDTDDISQKNEENSSKIQEKNDLFDEFLEFKNNNNEKTESSEKKKTAKNSKSVSEFENFFSVTNGLKRDSKIDRMIHESFSVLVGDVSEVDEVEVLAEDEEAEVLEAFRHAAAIPYNESSDVEDEHENKNEKDRKNEIEVVDYEKGSSEKKDVSKGDIIQIGNKEVNEKEKDESENGNDKVKGMKGVYERKDELPVHYFDVDFTDKSPIYSSGRSADQSSAPAHAVTGTAGAAVAAAVVHYHVASPTQSPSRSPNRSPSSSSPSSPSRVAHHKNTTFHSIAEVQIVVDNDEKGDKIEQNEVDIFNDDNGVNEGKIEGVSDVEKLNMKGEIADDDVLTVNDRGVKGGIRNDDGAECDPNESKLFEEIMVNFKIDDKLINFDFENASDTDENIELDGEIRDFDDKNPLESLLNLQERHLIQEKLHAKQQGYIKNQQMELLKLKKVVAIKLKEKEKENEDLKILRNELLLKNQIKMDLPANFGESNLSELKLSHLSISDNSSEIDGNSEMKELSSLTTPYLNPSRNNIYNTINRKNSTSSDSHNSDYRNKNTDNSNNNNNNNDKQINAKNIVPNNDNNKQKEIKPYKNNNKNMKSKNIPENILDDPYEKIPYVRKERSSHTELPMEYLSPKERSIRNSQKKKMEADQLLMTSEKAKNVPQNKNQNQDIPIADHIKVLRNNVRTISMKLSNQEEDVEHSLELWSILGELENQLKRNLSPTKKYMNNDVTERKLNTLKKEIITSEGKKIQKKQTRSKSSLNNVIKVQDIVCVDLGLECPAPQEETSRLLDFEKGVGVGVETGACDTVTDVSTTENTSQECTTPEPVRTQTHTPAKISLESKGGAGPKSAKWPRVGRAGALKVDRKAPGIIITPTVSQASAASVSLCNNSVTKHTLKSISMSKRITSPSYSSFFPPSLVPSPSSSYPPSSSPFLVHDEVPFDPTLSAKSSPDLSIFKSPLLRQRKCHLNQYSKRSCSWESTQLTGKYNTRFQYTSDITNGKKLNQMLDS